MQFLDKPIPSGAFPRVNNVSRDKMNDMISIMSLDWLYVLMPHLRRMLIVCSLRRRQLASRRGSNNTLQKPKKQ